MNWLREFKVWHRLLAAGLMLCIPLAMLAFFLVNEQNADIEFARKEIIGVAHLTAAMQLVSHIQQHRGLARRWLDGDAAARRAADQTDILIDQGFSDLADIEQRHGNLLDTADRRRAMQEQWSALRETWHGLNADRAWARHVMLAEDGLDLIRHLANTSNLILDPAIDSYYLMNIAVNILPVMADDIDRLRGVGSGAAALGVLSPSARDNLMGASARLQTVWRALVYDFEIVLKDDESRQVFGEPLTIWQDRLAALEGTVARHLSRRDNGGWADVDPDVYFIEASAVIEGAGSLFDLTAARLVTVLEARIDRTEQHRNHLLAGVLAAFLMAAVLGSVLVKSVTRPLGRAVAVFCQIQKGRYDNDIDMEAGGEPLAVLRSLAAMQDTPGTYAADQQRNQAALREARDNLERRVDERTRELTAANAKLIEEVAEKQRVEAELQHNHDLLAIAQAGAKLDLWVQYSSESSRFTPTGWLADFISALVTPKEHSNSEYLEFVHPRDRERISAVYDKFWRDPGRYAIEYDLVGVGGEVRT
ncbi:MAG: hypothetical protein VCD33_17215, partial [Alphaproteobacteria bacterium]